MLENYKIKCNLIEILDGVFLKIGSYTGDFSSMDRDTKRQNIIIGYIYDGFYSGIISSRNPFLDRIPKSFVLNKYSIYSIVPQTYNIKSTPFINCDAIEIIIDVKSSKKTLDNIFENFDISQFYEKMCYKLFNPFPRLKTLFNEIYTLKNKDILKVKILELLLLMDKYNVVSKQDYLRDVESFLLQNCFDNDISLKYLSKKFGVSISKLTQDFKATHKISIYQFIKQNRIQKASTLLKNKALSISEIANTVGYINVSAFCKNFKEYYGYNPKLYRNIEYP